MNRLIILYIDRLIILYMNRLIILYLKLLLTSILHRIFIPTTDLNQDCILIHEDIFIPILISDPDPTHILIVILILTPIIITIVSLTPNLTTNPTLNPPPSQINHAPHNFQSHLICLIFNLYPSLDSPHKKIYHLSDQSLKY